MQNNNGQLTLTEFCHENGRVPKMCMRIAAVPMETGLLQRRSDNRASGINIC